MVKKTKQYLPTLQNQKKYGSYAYGIVGKARWAHLSTSHHIKTEPLGEVFMRWRAVSMRWRAVKRFGSAVLDKYLYDNIHTASLVKAIWDVSALITTSNPHQKAWWLLMRSAHLPVPISPSKWCRIHIFSRAVHRVPYARLIVAVVVNCYFTYLFGTNDYDHLKDIVKR